MKIKCKECGAIVIEGDIKSVEKKNGGTKKIFDIGSDNKPQGTIFKNKSSDPKNWEGICSKCQATPKTKETK